MQGRLLAVRSRSTAPRRGVTLIELLFAASIMAITLLGVAGMFPAALRAVTEGGHQTKAMALAQMMIEAIRSEPFDLLIDRYAAFDTRQELPGYTCPIASQSTDASYAKMRLKCELSWTPVQESGQGLPDGYAVVAVRCLDPDGNVNGALPCPTELREVRVTVSWGQAGGKAITLLSHVARTE